MQIRLFSSLAAAALAVGCGDSDRGAPSASDPARSPLGPVGEGGGVRVYGGKALMLPDGPPCTREAGASGDRWCGFLATSETGRDDLYVVNVTQVLAGVPVACGDSDPNCILLGEEVIADANSWRPIYFDGDTLVYYDATLTPRVWRPGMDAGRLLADRQPGAELQFCAPASAGTAVVCLELPDVQMDPKLVQAELYVGTADGEAEPLLHPAAHVIIGSNETLKGVLRFKCGFPADGYVAWSTPESLDEPEILNLVRADDLASSVPVASDVFAWNVSPDASRWHWLTEIDEKGSGVLGVAPFPDGSDPIEVLRDVTDYAFTADSALVALTTEGDIVALPDPLLEPAEQRLLDQGAKGLLAIGNGGFVAYAKLLVGKTSSDLYVSRVDASETCALDETAEVPFSSINFSPDGEALLWATPTPLGYDAHVSELGTCKTTPLASDIALLGWIGDRTIVLVDDYDTTSLSGSLRFRNVPDTALRTRPTLVAEHVTSNAITGSTLLYTVKNADDTDGVYVRAFGE